MNTQIKAFKSAFPHTIPIFAGFIFLGMSYGFLMTSKGFAPIYPIAMSIFVLAGSMQFVAVNLLLSAFNPLYALLLTVMVNSRHIFYGLSMLNKYKDTGLRKLYLIFGMCDESFSVNCSVAVPKDVDRTSFMFYVTLLNHSYWVLGTSIGALLGNIVTFNTEGIDFALTCLFYVIFLNQWRGEDNHSSTLIGLGTSLVCLLIFGADSFIAPALISILIIFAVLKAKEDKKC